MSKMEILHDFSLRIGKGQALCLIGPNGAENPPFFILFSGLPISFPGQSPLAARMLPH